MKKYSPEILVILLATAIIIVYNIYQSEKELQPNNKKHIAIIEEVKLAWGFPLNSISIDTAIVKQNQNLSDILYPLGLNAQAIDKIARNSKEVFDVRRIRAGNKYYLINSDTARSPQHLVYEETMINYVVFNLDSQSVYRGQKEVDTLLQTTGGTITSSLWNAFVDNGASPILAVELSDIFAWTIDFFGIQANDEFKVIYDELFIEEKFAGIGHIHAARFKHAGSNISAYYYNNNEQIGYFDDEGNSLRKAFLKAPLSFSRISSHFSNSRLHPILKIRRPHHGVDYAAPKGTPVYSIGDGLVVKKAFQASGGGNYITIKHNSVYTSQYMHLSKYAPGMAPGVRIKQGQVIGYVGASGLASGPHLDFRIYKNGTPVDPLKVEAPPVEPISNENKEEFMILRDSLNIQLQKIETHKLKNTELFVAE